MINIDEVEFTIFDTETTGLGPRTGDRIVEIAAVRIKGMKRLGAYHTLVNSGREISAPAFAVNRISREMLKGAPQIEDILPDFMDFIRGSCLCSYNACFDLSFLNNELEIAGRSQPDNIIVVDILKMARRFLPGLERHALWFVARSLGVKARQTHRALSDVELALEVFNKLKAISHSKGGE